MICENERSTRNHVCTITIKIENKSDAKKNKNFCKAAAGVSILHQPQTPRGFCVLFWLHGNKETLTQSETCRCEVL